MNNRIYLKDFKAVVLEEAINRNYYNYYSNELLKMAIDYEIKNGLNFNFKNGWLYRKLDWISQPVGVKEIYKSEEEAAKWEFTSSVRNTASMIKNKYINI